MFPNKWIHTSTTLPFPRDEVLKCSPGFLFLERGGKKKKGEVPGNPSKMWECAANMPLELVFLQSIERATSMSSGDSGGPCRMEIGRILVNLNSSSKWCRPTHDHQVQPQTLKMNVQSVWDEQGGGGLLRGPRVGNNRSDRRWLSNDNPHQKMILDLHLPNPYPETPGSLRG